MTSIVMTFPRPKRSRSPIACKLPPVHSLGFDDQYDDLTNTSWTQSSVSVSGSSSSRLAPAVCSKYSVIGDPHSRKQTIKAKPKLWQMPNLQRESSLLIFETKDRPFDKKTLYGTKQQEIFNRIMRDDSTLVPKLPDIMDGHQDATCEKEKQYVTSDYKAMGPFRRFERDEVHVPSVYNNYFEKKRNKDLYVRHKFREEYRKRTSRSSTCAKNIWDDGHPTHYCDVLGKRFCKECEEYSNRLFSWKYERRKLFPYQYLYD